VAPATEVSNAQARTADAIAARVPRDSLVLISPLLAGRLADAGLDAAGGFGGLVTLRRGSDSGVAELAREAARRPVFVSSGALGLTSGQAGVLGATTEEVWTALHRCCGLETIMRTRGLPQNETIYRVRPRGMQDDG
jgi:hypothetical protein